MVRHTSSSVKGASSSLKSWDCS
uniref:Uncharacterized protein n=1 Tax=Arundo donax TaxID=35708 RepID=A0A0A8ZWM1_ARUDO